MINCVPPQIAPQDLDDPSMLQGGKPVRQVNAAEKRTASELENVWILFFSKIKSWIMQRAPLQVTGATSGVLQMVDAQLFSTLLMYAVA